AARRVDGKSSAEGDGAVFDRLPRFAGGRQAEVVDGHVLGGREAVVRLDALELPAVGETRAAEGVGDGAPRVGQDIFVLLGELVVEEERRGGVAPAENL